MGEWSVVVKDTEVNENNGTFIDWRIKLFGECSDASKQEPFPMPSEHDDDDHDVITGTPTYVSIDPSKGRPTSLPAVPSDHPDRPVNIKPSHSTMPTSTLASTSTSASLSVSTSALATDLPNVPPEDDTQDDHFLPHLFPTFGVSKRTQIWIYGAVGIILIFCIGLGVYLFIQRRKRRRSERDDYEFEELLDDGANGHVDGRRTKRRAGELYNAFAGGSEDEDDGLLSEAEEERDEEGVEEGSSTSRIGYRDEPALEEKRGGAGEEKDGGY